MPNTFNHEFRNPVEGKRSMKPAVAAIIKGDMNSFYNCGFVSVQDTLYDVTGRHYFHSCYIEGLVDFIMGNGQSIYQNCIINVTGIGYITAQSRDRADEPTGFVFKFGYVVGTGQIHLGRPWGPYSRVVFYKTTLPKIVAPEGWDAWNFKGKEANITYAEVDCKGPGSDTSKRVKWLKKLSLAEKKELTGPNYIDSDGWIGKQPLAIDA